MPAAWLSIGSNVEPERYVRSGVRALGAAFGHLLLSSVYESAPIGFAGAPFYNLVVGMITDVPIAVVIAQLRAIEDAHHRVRGGSKFAPRTLDIDLLAYGDAVVSENGLQLPRDEILRYAFVLRPLAEVAPRERHPVCGKTYAELWREFAQGAQPLRRLAFNFGAPELRQDTR